MESLMVMTLWPMRQRKLSVKSPPIVGQVRYDLEVFDALVRKVIAGALRLRRNRLLRWFYPDWRKPAQPLLLFFVKLIIRMERQGSSPIICTSGEIKGVMAWPMIPRAQRGKSLPPETPARGKIQPK